MLKQIRRLEKTQRFILLIFAGLMGLSLVFFYAPQRNAGANVAADTEAIAAVNGDEILVRDLTTLRESYQQMFGGQFSIAQMGGERRLLDGLIRDRIVAQEARRLGLSPSKAEVADAVRKRFSDASGKFVGYERYKQSVLSQFGDVERFELQMRDSVAARKLRAFIAAGVQVSDKEVQDEYVRTNTSYDLLYVPVVAAQLAKKINPSDEEVQKFYDEHKNDFFIGVPQKKIRYLYIAQEKMGEKLQISDEELRTTYNELKPEQKMAGVRVQQIVFRVAHPDLDQQVLAKASNLAAQLRDPKTLTAPEDKFAEAARGQSEDPATAKQGGWLQGLVRKNPNSKDLLQNTLEMQPGQVSDPMKTGNAYYIFRRGDSVEKTFEEARPELLASKRNSKSYFAAAELAARAAARLKETKDFQQVAAEFAPQANMTTGEMIRETPFVKPEDDVPEIGVSQQFEKAIEPLNNPGDIGDRVSIKGGFAIPALAERREPRVPDFAEVREQATERLRNERAQGQLEQAARELAGSSNSPDALKAAAEKYGLSVETLPSYRVGTPLGDLGTSAAADEAISGLKEGEVAKNPIRMEEEWVVVGLTKRKEADLAEFAKQREQLTKTALDQRRDQVFDDYISSVRNRYERDDKIKVYDDVLKRIQEEPSAAPPTPGGGMPGGLPGGGAPAG